MFSPLWGFSKYYEAQFKFCRNAQEVIPDLSFNMCCISCLTCKKHVNVSRCLFEIWFTRTLVSGTEMCCICVTRDRNEQTTIYVYLLIP